MPDTIAGALTFLGTGTSMGVPSLACSCAVCTSADARDKRLRPSILLRWPASSGRERRVPSERVVVIDTGPDFRTQALRENLQRVDAVFYTHSHADHILGMDDLRPLSFATHRESGPIPLYVTPETRRVLERIYAYTFSPDSKYPHRARVELQDIHDGSAVVDNLRFLPVPVLHGELPITGYRFGNTAYLTDVSTIPESSFALLEGLETLIVSALRHVPHPSHATVKQAVAWGERIGAKQTWFTHISHDLGHEATNAMLPDGMALAYDGLTIPFEAPSAAVEREEAHG
ncbi:MAG TPA: MBL fold metallo-hydrolase [Acidobacteriaceae bacterium]|nr:MBL fold metallo-hydrolase [Acidobacteriaceae bacterium]